MTATSHATTSDPTRFGLPQDYIEQRLNLTDDANRTEDEYWSPWRIGQSAKYQFHIYRWAARIVRRAQMQRVLDIGCGVATKLEQHLVPTGAALVGIDQHSAIAKCHDLGRTGTFHAVDLERPVFDPNEPFDLIICADVIEHLVNPDPMLDLIQRCLAPGGLVLFSTPDRARERGRNCRASQKPEHVREWERHEFNSFLKSRGFAIHVSLLFPKDDTPAWRGFLHECAFQAYLARRSPWACHGVVASVH